MTQEIAKRIRQLRQQHKLSMAQLAEKSGVTRSMISQVEKGEALPSIQTLNSISKVLDVSLSEFFYTEDVHEEKEKSLIVREGQHRRLMVPGCEVIYNILSPDMSNPMDFLLIEFPAGSVENPFKHDGTEFFFVLEGELTMVLNQEHYLLRAGDSGSFNSNLTHYMRNNSDKSAKIIIAAQTRF